MYILWEPYKDGYTVKDTKDGVIEYFTKPVLRKLFRKGIEIKGISCDKKNVIHFHAQHSMSELKKQSSAIKAKLLLSGKVKIDEGTKKIYFNLDGTEGIFKVPYAGDYTYVIRLYGEGSDVSQQYGLYFDDLVKRVSIGVTNMPEVILRLPKSATYVGFGQVDNVGNLAIDFNHVNVAPCGCIDRDYGVTILNYTISSIYAQGNSLSACADAWLEVPKGITNLRLEYLLFMPTVLVVPKHVKTFKSDNTRCRIATRVRNKYARASDYLKRANYAYTELYNKPENIRNFQSKARNYLFNEEQIDVFREAPYIIIIEDPKVTRVDADLRGVVLVTPKGTRSYLGGNIRPNYNIILEV